jgi:hypothetical protein
MSLAPLNISGLATTIGNTVANAFGGVSQEQRNLAARIQTIPALIRHTSAMIGTLDRIEARRAQMQAARQSWSDEAEAAYWQLREVVNTRRNQLIVIKNRTYAAAASALQAGRMTQRDFDAIAPMLQNGEQGSNENPATVWQQAQAAAAGGLGVGPLVIIAAGVAIAIAAFGIALGLSALIRNYIDATSDANSAATEATTYWQIWAQQQTANPGSPAPALPDRTPGVTTGSNANSGSNSALMLAAGVALAAGVVYFTTRPRRN